MSLTLATSGFTASIASSPAARSRARAARGASSHRRCKPHAFQRRAAALIADSAADLGLDGGEYSRELETALEAVRLASTLCQDVQGQLMRMDEQAETKEDRSLVTAGRLRGASDNFLVREATFRWRDGETRDRLLLISRVSAGD
jgi:3'(2'), 5'-bisphosphate nucleotidase